MNQKLNENRGCIHSIWVTDQHILEALWPHTYEKMLRMTLQIAVKKDILTSAIETYTVSVESWFHQLKAHERQK